MHPAKGECRVAPNPGTQGTGEENLAIEKGPPCQNCEHDGKEEHELGRLRGEMGTSTGGRATPAAGTCEPKDVSTRMENVEKTDHSQGHKKGRKQHEAKGKKWRTPRNVVRTRLAPQRRYHGYGVGCHGELQNGAWQDVACRKHTARNQFVCKIECKAY